MRSRQYVVELPRQHKTQIYRVYADRSVEVGCLENDEFIPSLRYRTRNEVADLLKMAHSFGYQPRKEYL